MNPAPLQPYSRFLELNGSRHHYLDFGGDDLSPIIFIHGTGLLASMWLPYAEALRDRSHSYALDLRGHGDSDKTSGRFDWPTLGDDLAAFIQTLHLSKPLCVGHSMGATTILLAEGRHPGIIGRAVLIDPIILEPAMYRIQPNRQTHPMAAGALKRRAVWNSREEMIASYREKFPFKTWRKDQLELFVERGTENLPEGGVKLKCPPETEAQCYLGSHALDPWPLLSQIQIPILLLRGDSHDAPEGVKKTLAPLEKVRDALPDAELSVVPRSSHFLPMENPDAVISAILKCSKR